MRQKRKLERMELRMTDREVDYHEREGDKQRSVKNDDNETNDWCPQSTFNILRKMKVTG